MGDIYKLNKTGFLISMILSGIIITGLERHLKLTSVQPKNREQITVIQAINAEGQAVQPFIISAGQYHLANWYQDSPLPGDWAITMTQTGWTNNETGLKWLKHFNRCIANRSIGHYRL